MVNGPILPSLWKEEVMLTALDYFKQCLYTMLLCIVVVLIFLDFSNIYHATQTLLNKADSVGSFEFGGAKVIFTSERVDAAFNELKMDGVEPAQRSRALDLIHELKPTEFVRLMYVGQLQGLCEYETPAALSMRYNVATDYILAEKKLAVMIDDPILLRQMQAKVNEQIARTRHSDNGKPFHCYVMQLTPDGANVKTALVGSFGEMFREIPAKTIPSGQQIALK